MKKIIILLFIAVNLNLSAQNNSIEAFKKSYTYESDKEYTKAIKVLEDIPHQTSYAANLRLGWLYYLNGEYIKSKSHYTKSISLSSNSIEARIGLVYPLSAMNSWDDVINVYDAILSIDANHTSSHYQLAYIYFVRKKYLEAEKHLKHIINLYPFDYDSNALLGTVYVKLGKIKEAKKHYTIALEYNPTDTEIEKIVEGL